MSWISLTPFGKNVVDSISDWWKERVSVANSSSKAIYDAIKKDPDPVETGKKFLVEKEKELEEETGFTPPGSVYSGTYSYGSGSGSGSYAGQKGISADMKAYIDYVTAMTDKNNAFAADQAQKQMDFQKMMSDTAHQREVSDLQAAGLNPVLSVSGGSGAAAASGAMAQPDTTNSKLMAEIAMEAISGLTTTASGLSYGFSGRGSSGLGQKILERAIPQIASRVISKLF